MIRKNNLEILKEENVDRIANMGGEMWDQLTPVFRYLSISMISEFEIESIKKRFDRNGGRGRTTAYFSGRETWNTSERIL